MKYALSIIFIFLGLNHGFTQVDSLSESRFVQVQEILFVGNQRTQEEIILREMSVKQGDRVYYSDLKDQLKSDERNIYNTRLFNTVEVSLVDISEDRVYVLVSMDERWYLFPSPILELVDRNFNDWWVNKNRDLSRINYGLRVQQKNVRGRNETLQLIGQLGFTKRVGIGYLMPYLGASPNNGLNFRFSYSENNNVPWRTNGHLRQFEDADRSIYSSTSASIKYTRRNNFYDYHSITAGFERNFADDIIVDLNPNFFGSGKNFQRFFSLSYSYRRDKRDVIAYPLQGYMGEGSISQSGFGLYDDVDFTTLFARFSYYKPFKNEFYLANHSAAYANFYRTLPYSNYFGLGYTVYFVRGYELFLIEGDRIWLNKTTFKKLIFSNTSRIENIPIRQFRYLPIQVYLKTYFDWGYVRNFPNYELNTDFSNRLLAGTGIGLDFVTAYDVVLRTEYSLNDTGRHGFFLHLKKEF